MSNSEDDMAPTELGALREWYISKLAAFYSKPEAEAWLDAPHGLLRNESAWSRIVRNKDGDVASVLQIIDQLESGAYL